MPWTFAHPAAVLPFRKLCPRHLSFAGLVTGSMMPDVGYYVGHLSLGGRTHSLAGIVEICVPAGLVVLLLVRALHQPVARMLPAPHRQALLALAPAPSLLAPRALGISAASVLLGALTHVAWDAFTHASGYVVTRVAALQPPLFSFDGRVFHVYNVLQHASTVAGITLLAAWYVRFLRTPVADGTRHRETARRALIAALLLVAAVCAFPFAYEDATHHGATVANAFLLGVHTLVYATTAFAVLLASTALALEYRRGTRGPAQGRAE